MKNVMCLCMLISNVTCYIFIRVKNLWNRRCKGNEPPALCSVHFFCVLMVVLGLSVFKRVNVAEFLHCVDIHDLLILMIMFEEIAHKSVRLTTT